MERDFTVVFQKLAELQVETEQNRNDLVDQAELQDIEELRHFVAALEEPEPVFLTTT